MHFSFWCAAVTLPVLFPLQVNAFASGKVEPACTDMMPQHNFTAQSSSPPYTLTTSKTSYLPGEKITVTLKNTSADYAIEGFLIQARQTNSKTALGSFVTSSSDVQTLTCTTAASAVSHTSDSSKSIVQVTWIAPSTNMSDIQFRATVANNLSIFWVNISGQSLTYAGGSYITASLCITYISLLFSILLTFPSQF